jgi:predicted KAP-like P-loop ATPase
LNEVLEKAKAEQEIEIMSTFNEIQGLLKKKSDEGIENNNILGQMQNFFERMEDDESTVVPLIGNRLKVVTKK